MCYSPRTYVNFFRIHGVPCIFLMRFHCCQTSMENGKERGLALYFTKISKNEFLLNFQCSAILAICQLVNRLIQFYFTSLTAHLIHLSSSFSRFSNGKHSCGPIANSNMSQIEIQSFLCAEKS